MSRTVERRYRDIDIVGILCQGSYIIISIPKVQTLIGYGTCGPKKIIFTGHIGISLYYCNQVVVAALDGIEVQVEIAIVSIREVD